MSWLENEARQKAEFEAKIERFFKEEGNIVYENLQDICDTAWGQLESWPKSDAKGRPQRWERFSERHMSRDSWLDGVTVRVWVGRRCEVNLDYERWIGPLGERVVNRKRRIEYFAVGVFFDKLGSPKFYQSQTLTGKYSTDLSEDSLREILRDHYVRGPRIIE